MSQINTAALFASVNEFLADKPLLRVIALVCGGVMYFSVAWELLQTLRKFVRRKIFRSID